MTNDELVRYSKQVMHINYKTSVGVSSIRVIALYIWQAIFLALLAYTIAKLFNLDWLAMILGEDFSEASMTTGELYALRYGSLAASTLAVFPALLVTAPVSVGSAAAFLEMYRASKRDSFQRASNVKVSWVFSYFSDYKRVITGLLYKELLMLLATIPYIILYIANNMIWYFTNAGVLTEGFGNTLVLLVTLLMYASLALQLMQAARLMFVEYILIDDKSISGVMAVKKSLAIMKDKETSAQGLWLIIRYVALSYLSLFTFGVWYIMRIGPYMGIAMAGFYNEKSKEESAEYEDGAQADRWNGV